MLKQLRSQKAMKRIMFWTLVAVIPSFVFFYGWGKSSQQDYFGDRAIAKVKDRWFGLRWRSLGAVEQEMAEEALIGDVLQWGMDNRLEIPREEIRSLVGAREIAHKAIDCYYLQRLAREKGFGVTPEEVRIMLNQMFASTPNPEDAYERLLRYRRLSDGEFRRMLLHGSTLGRAESYIGSRAKASLFDLWQEYLISQEILQISYTRVSSAEFRDRVEVTTDSLLLYYQDNPEDYRIGDQVKYRYCAVFLADVEKAIDPTTDSARAYYEENRDTLFTRKRSAAVRHVFLSVPRDAGTTAAAAIKARTRIGDLATSLAAGADFAALANQYTEDPNNQPDPDDPNTRRGGLLPYPIQEDGSPPPFGEEFRQTALALDEDEVSTPLRSPFGYHLIKADSVTTAGTLTFDEVTERARRGLRDQLANAELRRRGEQMKNFFADSSYSTLDAFAQAAQMEVVETDLLEFEDAMIPRIGSLRDNLELIQELKDGEFIDGVLQYPSQTPRVYYVLELNKRVPSHVEPFEDVIEEVRLDYTTSQSVHLAHSVAIDIQRKAKTLDDLKRLAQERGYTVDQTSTFTRESLERPGSILPNLDPRFPYATLRYPVDTIHITAQGDPKRPVAYVVWYFEKRQPPSLEQFREDLPMIQAEYLERVQDALVVEWLHDMRRRIPAQSPFLTAPGTEPTEDEGG